MISPFFSIIIPTYNRGGFLRTTLDMALDQTIDSFEVIVVDDGSTDNTRQIIESYQDSRVRYVYQENRERAAARNLGANVATGIYVTFCDSDDQLYPHYLEEAMSIVTSCGQVPWLHVGYEIIRGEKKSLKMNAVYKDIVPVLARGNPLSCLGVFIRRDLFRDIRFNESRQMSGSEDWEFWLRMSARFPLVQSSRISAALISHDSRSVVQMSELKLQLRKFLCIGYALEDKKAAVVYAPYRKMLYAYSDTYIALHLMLEGKSITSFKYIFKALREYPLSLLSRRMLAILKLYFLNLVQKV